MRITIAVNDGQPGNEIRQLVQEHGSTASSHEAYDHLTVGTWEIQDGSGDWHILRPGSLLVCESSPRGKHIRTLSESALGALQAALTPAIARGGLTGGTTKVTLPTEADAEPEPKAAAERVGLCSTYEQVLIADAQLLQEAAQRLQEATRAYRVAQVAYMAADSEHHERVKCLVVAANGGRVAQS